ncbi:MAG: type II toxin-antitoxin system HipA family toxin [Angustibacter sp.]
MIRATVFKNGQACGELRRDGPRTEFRYLPEYLAAGLDPVASTLPLTEFPVSEPGGAIPAFFAGLLPEGRRLTNLRRTIKASADDELSLLLAVGAEPVGDVSITSGEVPAQPKALATAHRDFSGILFADLLGDAGIVDPFALAGVQDKVSARMLPLAQRGRQFILKLNPPEFPYLVENEAYFLGLARRAKFPVARARMVHDRARRTGLLVERFDRVAGRRFAVEDASQLLGLYPADKYTVSAEEVARAIIAVCPARVVAAREVFRQFVFAWLTGNGDLHAKNITVLATESGEFRVAPAYDIPASLPYGDHSLALSIAGRTPGLSRRRMLELAHSLELPERAAVKTLDDCLAATASAAEDWAGGVVPMGPKALRNLVRGVRDRRRALG